MVSYRASTYLHIFTYLVGARPIRTMCLVVLATRTLHNCQHHVYMCASFRPLRPDSAPDRPLACCGTTTSIPRQQHCCISGRWAGTFISLTTATLGAMCSYFVALFLLKGLITRLFPKRVRLLLPQQSWQAFGLPKVLPPVFVMHLMPWFRCWYHFYTYSLLSFMDFVVLHGFRFGIGSRCNTYLSLSFGAQLCRLLQGEFPA